MYFFDIGRGIGEGIQMLLIIAIIGVISIISWIGYGGYKLFISNDEQVIETSHKITPTIKLHTDGTKIDTIYVYIYKK